MLKCPSCGRAQAPGLLCGECGAPLPVVDGALDLFAALGVARRLVIDLPGLETAYHQLGRRVHPDRFAQSPPAVRAASLNAAALLTRAYRTLRDPVTRGLYWLELNGGKLSENNKSVPADLAELVFEIQDQLAEMRDRAGAGGDREGEARAGIAERRAELSDIFDRAYASLARNFSAWDADPARTHGQALTAELKAILSRIAYLRTLLRDVDRELAPPATAAAARLGAKEDL